MKIYLAYRFAGEDFQTLSEELAIIANAIAQGGHSVYYSVQHEDHFKENNFTNKQILDYSLKHLDKADALLAYIKSPEKSEGMLIEIGYALAKDKPIYAAIRNGVKTNFVSKVAQRVILFDQLDDLEGSLISFQL